MWRSLLREAGWSELRDFLSPGMLEVIPARTLRSQLGALARRWRDAAGFAEARRRRAEALQRLSLPVVLTDTLRSHHPGDPQWRGQQVLALYFHQIEDDGPALLDLRHDRFAAREQALHWAPCRLWTDWDGGFREALREVYAGFYRGEDARFDAALRELGMDCARDTFRDHFGRGDQTQVTFRMPTLRHSLHQALLQCQQAKRHVHPGFVPLGIYLALLYEHLETLGRPFNVRRAWERARGVTRSAA